MTVETTEDALLGGRVKFTQPKSGYRAAIDPVLLAAAVNAKGNKKILDVGIGAGAAALCLAARLPKIQIAGIEIQEELAKLARHNAEINEFSERIEVTHADVLFPPKNLAPGTFDHVMTNPPFVEHSRGRGSPNSSKALANFESSVPLEIWIKFCLSMLRRKGTLTMIHRADRMHEVLTALAGQAGEAIVYPLWPGPDKKPSKRFLISCRKGVRTPMLLSTGLILHQADGSYTASADKILRDGETLDLSETVSAFDQ
ncbi:MAG: methyltransferase [Rhodospirillaceae bacterium]|jgi:tRNA1(Val) A37 N6-methylase TrmN6|nr:methyltransferase [Rhodospirillaceae bacterium]MBT7487738.1 methyltransferase [Rhodospirillales bacterium]MBT4700029.1 methyltransferase [Rhodospirillaceae bacterium]MBT5035063.1 methyltransferase [Rhodospirillaceae bacterium]MBT6222235.1 methyltransferase [Rhodospirillaceae bacterium]